jgi:hypothetical protein
LGLRGRGSLPAGLRGIDQGKRKKQGQNQSGETLMKRE